MRTKLSASSKAEEQRIARLASLCRLWGAVKFFHPWIARQRIDWDRSLIKAIPAVSAANSPAAFRAAVESLLLTLNDPITHTGPLSAADIR
jgi:hypothetical protein